MSASMAESFPCSNCGAKLQYDASTQGMACPFCGHKQAVVAPPVAAAPPQASAGQAWGQGPALPPGVREIPLEEGMRMAARGFGAPVTTVGCKDCGATVHVGQGERTTSCAFCGSQQVLSQEAGEQPIRPESLLPFKIAKEDANQRFGAWLGTLWFRPNDLKKIAKVQEMGGLYVPFWTFDSHVSSTWSAERGWHYYETESYTEVVNGQRIHRTRQVQRTRWEHARGARRDFFDDVLVCAGKALPGDLVEKLSSFDVKQLQPYRPEFLAGWRAEAYALDLMPAFGVAQQKMTRVQEGRCAGDIGGDTHRGLSVANDFAGNTFKHVLLPVWIAAYRYNGKVFRFLVNGQTGEVVGVAPWSFWKIAGLVVAILAVIGVIVGIVMSQQEAPAPPAPPQPALTSSTVPFVPPVPTPPPSAAPTHATPHAGPHPSATPTPHPSPSPHPTATPTHGPAPHASAPTTH